ncbi:MAG: helix-turn-helix transcriptional regulator [Clostridium sp.]
MATKDYIKFRTSVLKDKNLSNEEISFFQIIFDYHNTNLGYAFPSYEVLMDCIRTKRRAKVSKLIKSLVEKGYLRVEKNGRANIYYIEKYLFLNKKSKGSSPKSEKESNIQPRNQYGLKVEMVESVEVEIEHEVEKTFNDSDLAKVQEKTGFTKDKALALIKAAKNDLSKLFKGFDYANTKNNVKDIFAYTIWAIKNNIGLSEYNAPKSKNLKFNNFKARDYNYDKLEKALLGWETYSTEELLPV